MVPEKEPPLARSLGAFFGHIVDAIASDPAPAQPARTEFRRTTQEVTQPDGVVLRRIVIEEVVLPAGAQLPPARPALPEAPRPAHDHAQPGA
jgi:hypothetical protein